VAGDREVQRLGERTHRRRLGHQRGLGHEPQQRRPVAVLERADGGQQVAVDGDVAVARLRDRHQRVGVDAHADAAALGVGADTAHRVGADARDEPRQHGDGILAACRAARPARADDPQRAPGRLREVAERRVRARQRIGAVEYQRPQPVGVVDRERLAEVRAVGVAVVVDLLDAQRVEHVGQVVDRGAGVVAVDAGAELAGAAAGPPHVVGDAVPQRLAVERT
jgi:hypothetical protein